MISLPIVTAIIMIIVICAIVYLFIMIIKALRTYIKKNKN